MYQNEKSHLNARLSSLLDQLEEEELRSRYDLLRKQTKSFYSFFRQMLRETFVEQLRQYDEQTRDERRSLHEHLTSEEQIWTKQWRQNQPKRYERFLQRQKNDYERDYLIRKVNERKRGTTDRPFDLVSTRRERRVSRRTFASDRSAQTVERSIVRAADGATRRNHSDSGGKKRVLSSVDRSTFFVRFREKKWNNRSIWNEKNSKNFNERSKKTRCSAARIW